jgi:cytochrome c553
VSRLKHRQSFRAGLLLVGLLAPVCATAQQLTRQQTDYFENKIRPLFVSKCYKCHSQEAPKLKGGLSLESREGWAKGGDNGPSIVPGDPEKSMLITAVRYKDPDLQMPPKGEKLSDEQIATLENWVKMGAPDPRTGTVVAVKKNAPRDHWAFKPVSKAPVPEVPETNWVQTPVDAFILAKLKENGMKPSPPADKRTLIRRATFDLTGLPPTQQELKDFLADNSPGAFAKVVDRLLASPHYGERWGRYWLDTARYSDTKGDVKKMQEDPRYPYAWTYRDYVVRSFNEDKPYSRFIVEQIAADKVLANQPDKRNLAAMGFLTVGERFNENQNDIINDRIDVVTKGFLGLTVTCARCHDHKFDPIPTKDYYSLHGIFASSVEPQREPVIGTVDTLSPEYIDYYNKVSGLEKKITTLTGQRRGARGTPRLKEIQQQLVQLRGQLTELDMNNPAAPVRAMVLHDRPNPSDSPVFIRGEAENKGDVVPRQFLSILSGPNRTAYRSGSGRLELANSIANRNNPLTARVIVNRIWMHHFDAGIVTTPDDFGNQSAAPSHPELLDYLAARFMDEGWSIKKMHRLIMLSSVYQESSENNPRFAQSDPHNRLLWRANIRRMEFEEVRDSLLAIGGKLDETIGGRPVILGAYPYSTRRTVYGYIDRRDLPELYNQFDFANPDVTTGRRYETIVPQQSLFLMNSPLVMEQAKNLVSLPEFQSKESDQDRVKVLYELVYQREATPVEIQLGVRFVLQSPENENVPRMGAPARQGNQNPVRTGRLQGAFASVPPGERKPLAPWEKYAHALMQANEAMFVN